MTIPATWEPLTDVDPVMTIAHDLFATMIDGEPGHLHRWLGGTPTLDDPRFTWVDVSGPIVTRVMLMAGRETGANLTRALLDMSPDEPVSDVDFADAVGELANVVGGNVKSLVTNPGLLTLPVVTHQMPDMANWTPLLETYFDWKGSPMGVSLWALTHDDGPYPVKPKGEGD